MHVCVCVSVCVSVCVCMCVCECMSISSSLHAQHVRIAASTTKGSQFFDNQLQELVALQGLERSQAKEVAQRRCRAIHDRHMCILLFFFRSKSLRHAFFLSARRHSQVSRLDISPERNTHSRATDGHRGHPELLHMALDANNNGQ